VKQWVAEAIILSSVTAAEEAVVTVTSTIRDTVQYWRRDAKGVFTPCETLVDGAGPCGDLAIFMLEALRVIGLPARFASGYIDRAASEAGRASTHAWAEADLPEIGWTGPVPPFCETTSGNHIVNGVSHNPAGSCR
jgi:transglutaminase-like putative cysteine protease